MSDENQTIQGLYAFMGVISQQLISAGEFLKSMALQIGEAYERVVILQAVLQDKGILTDTDVAEKRQVLKDVLALGRQLGDKPEAGGGPVREPVE